jgi:hypothetical protein
MARSRQGVGDMVNFFVRIDEVGCPSIQIAAHRIRLENLLRKFLETTGPGKGRKRLFLRFVREIKIFQPGG